MDTLGPKNRFIVCTEGFTIQRLFSICITIYLDPHMQAVCYRKVFALIGEFVIFHCIHNMYFIYKYIIVAGWGTYA